LKRGGSDPKEKKQNKFNLRRGKRGRGLDTGRGRSLTPGKGKIRGHRGNRSREDRNRGEQVGRAHRDKKNHSLGGSGGRVIGGAGEEGLGGTRGGFMGVKSKAQCTATSKDKGVLASKTRKNKPNCARALKNAWSHKRNEIGGGEGKCKWDTSEAKTLLKRG